MYRCLNNTGNGAWKLWPFFFLDYVTHSPHFSILQAMESWAGTWEWGYWKLKLGMIPRKYCSYYPCRTVDIRSKKPCYLEGVLPDDRNKLAHGQLLRNEELGFVQKRQVLLLVVPLDNYLPVQEQGRDQAQSWNPFLVYHDSMISRVGLVSSTSGLTQDLQWSALYNHNRPREGPNRSISYR